ncbi:MAG: HPr family phosphocarrier protein [Blautia hansenii]
MAYGKSESENPESVRTALENSYGFVNSILKYDALVQFQYEKNNVKGTVNLKSLLSIVAAGVRQGQEIEITCEGKDEKEALRAAVQAVESGLGENLKK